MVRILQANLQRKAVAHDIALTVAKENHVDILVISEPNLTKIKDKRWLVDKRQDVAMYILNRKIEIGGSHKMQGHLTLNLDEFYLTGCYVSPRTTLERYEEYVTDVLNVVEQNTERMILGDFNAKSPMWGSELQDEKGQMWEEAIETRDMVVINEGSTPTWRRGASFSHIDVTCATKTIARKVTGWRVMEEESLSDHALIIFEVGKVRRKKEEKEGKKIIALDRLRSEIIEQFRLLEDSSQDTQGEGDLVTALRRAQDRATIRRAGHILRVPYWWSEEIETERKRCIWQRRQVDRHRGRNPLDPDIPRLIQEYKDGRKMLTKMIKASKRDHWKELCDELESDIWGQGYQIATRNMKRPGTPYELTSQTKMEIARQLFPRTENREDDQENETSQEIFDFEPFTIKQIQEAAGKMKRKKAPGCDGILAETVQCAVEIEPERFVRLFNRLVREGRFPPRWKEARLLLIWKGKTPMGAPGSQRPICLLDTLGKMFEGLIRDRLVEDIERGTGLSREQYGFRKGRSTIQASETVQKIGQEERRCKLCALITIDVQNAFNTASWRHIMEEVRTREVKNYLQRILRDYLRDRAIHVDKERMEVTTGVPQGSVLGPTLWNILYDGVLRLDMPPDVHTLAFADDLAMVVKASNPEEMMDRSNTAMERIIRWMEAHDLRIAPHKTEAILLKGNRKTLNVKIRVDGMEIEPRREVKYLGIYMDVQNTFGPHVQRTCDKATERVATLARIMPNIGGPSSRRRQMLSGVVHSIILYGAPVWRKVIKIGRHRNRLISTQRKALLRVAMAYRTVSAVALQIITGTPPIDLLVEERGRVHDREDSHMEQAKREERETTLQIWQRKWETEAQVGRWTKVLIPNVLAWYRCEHRRVGYYLTQFLTGHGSFRTYTRRIGKEEEEECVYCGSVDTAEHTVMRCQRWRDLSGPSMENKEKEERRRQKEDEE